VHAGSGADAGCLRGARATRLALPGERGLGFARASECATRACAPRRACTA
jgi:hypothetical protein